MRLTLALPWLLTNYDTGVNVCVPKPGAYEGGCAREPGDTPVKAYLNVPAHGTL